MCFPACARETFPHALSTCTQTLFVPHYQLRSDVYVGAKAAVQRLSLPLLPLAHVRDQGNGEALQIVSFEGKSEGIEL